MKLYVASSWRNPHQPEVVGLARDVGCQVYDFRNPGVEGPAGGPEKGFSWGDIASEWQDWTVEEYRDALRTPRACEGFAADMDALEWADAVVAVMPCGRSSHLELGWACGAGKRTAIYYPPVVVFEPELMAKMSTILIGPEELRSWLVSKAQMFTR